MKKLISLLLLCSLCCACGGDRPFRPTVCHIEQAIRNSTTAQQIDAVALLSSNVGQCTGSLIHTQTILTAAHCVREVDTVDVFLNDEHHVSSEIIVHPSWVYSPDKASRNDLALIILDKEITTISPIQLNPDIPVVGEQATLIGFGITDREQSDGSILRFGTTTLNHVSDSVISFGSNDESSICSGDSGGPTLLDNRQIGVHWATPRDTCTTGMDTPVYPFLDWITENSIGTCPVQ